MVSITLRFKWGTGGWGYTRGGRRWRVAGGWVLRVVGLSGGLGLITGVKKIFKKNTPGCSPP